MAKLHLTDRALRGLKTELQQEDFYDEVFPAFGVRVTRPGTKAFFVRYRADGKNRRQALGNYGVVSLAEARARARAFLADLERGVAPAAPQPTRVPSRTFAWLAEEFMERHSKPNKRTWRSDESMLRADLLPAFGRQKIQDLRRSDIQKILDGIVDRGAPIQANRVFALLHKMLRFAVSRGHLDVNPMASMERPSPERKRDRVLTPNEVRILWRELEKELAQVRAAFRVLLLTAQRSGEVVSMTWSSLEDGLWRLSAEATKAKRLHLVPLAEPVLELLQAVPRVLGSDWVFPSPRGTDGHLGGSALSHTAARISARAGFKFRPHDLRRTAASMMAELGVNRFVIGQVLNHADSSVTAVYDRHSYLPEKRDALERLARRVAEIVGDASVPE